MTPVLASYLQTASIVIGVLVSLTILLRFSSQFGQILGEIRTELHNLCGRLGQLDERNHEAHQEIRGDLQEAHAVIGEQRTAIAGLKMQFERDCRERNGGKR